MVQCSMTTDRTQGRRHGCEQIGTCPSPQSSRCPPHASDPAHHVQEGFLGKGADRRNRSDRARKNWTKWCNRGNNPIVPITPVAPVRASRSSPAPRKLLQSRASRSNRANRTPIALIIEHRSKSASEASGSDWSVTNYPCKSGDWSYWSDSSGAI
jgi:hypothetical protein